jgi:hypothetical protein
MDIRGLGLEDFQAIVAYVSKGDYDGNVVVERNAHWCTLLVSAGRLLAHPTWCPPDHRQRRSPREGQREFRGVRWAPGRAKRRQGCAPPSADQ